MVIVNVRILTRRLVALLSLVLFSGNVFAQGEVFLWQLPSGVEQFKSTENHLYSRFPVIVNAKALESLAQHHQLRIQLPFGDVEFILNQRKKINGMTLWKAQQIDSKLTLPDALFFISSGKLSAWIPTMKGTYRLKDGMLFREYKMGGKKSDFKIPTLDISATRQLFSDTGKKPESNSVVARAGDLIIRVLFVVTNEFSEGKSNVADTIAEYIAANNSIYETSNVNIQIESAGIISADIEQYTPDQILDNISSSTNEDSTNGQIPQELITPILQARLNNRADFITVMTKVEEAGLCGQGWLNGDANKSFTYRFGVNVVSETTSFGSGNTQDCSLDTLGHELGHNMGLGHSLKQGSVGNVFTYGRGYGVDNQFTTVMAYPQEFGSAVAVPFYSSPELTCLPDFPCGLDRTQSDGADAVHALNQVKYEISLLHNDAVTTSFSAAAEDLDSALRACIEETNPDLFTNLDLRSFDCRDTDITGYQGLNNFPNLEFIQINSSTNPDLSPLKNLMRPTTLNLALTEVEDLRPIAHLKDQVTFLQFVATNLSCQQQNVAESWGISRYLPLGNCMSLSNDDDDFDSDGQNNLLDTDDDNDGIDDIADIIPFDASNEGDIDNDGVADADDAFPYDENESLDTDFDTIGNNADSDDDNDGVLDADDCAPLDNAVSTGCSEPERSFVAYDYDGDGKADIGVRRASTFFQYIKNSGDGEIQRVEFGRDENDISVSGDFDGDKIADVAVRRASNQIWYIKNSADGDIQRVNFGKQREDIPVPADYDGDGITDIAVRRPSNFFWYTLNSSDSEIQRIQFGRDSGDIPVPGDYDGDKKADVAVRRPSNQTWYILNSSDGEIQRIVFGRQSEDIPVPADYDGDGKTDIAVRRPSTQFWYILNSSDGEIQRIRFGLQAADIPIVADYDGDGKADIAVRRPSTQLQYILRSSDNEIERVTFGRNSADMPLAAPVMTRFANDVSNEGAQQTDLEEGFEREIISLKMAQEEDVIE